MAQYFAELIPHYDEDDYSIFIESVDASPDAYQIVLAIVVQQYGETEIDRVELVVSVVNPIEVILALGWSGYIHQPENHPLLWTYSEPSCELYFSNRSNNHHQALVEIFKFNHETFGDYANSGELSRITGQLFAVVMGTSGLVARGSKSLLTQYQNILNSHGFQTSILENGPFPQRDGRQFNGVPQDLKILLLGNGYVIAEKIEFSRRA